MKKLIQLVVIGTILSTMLAGCIIVPRGHGGGHYDRNHRSYR
ncbi:MAG: hypothetical protein NWQ13_03435 [Glaciimonas sp.]|nr:hypothetical protein [Glaciimonas sp.]